MAPPHVPTAAQLTALAALQATEDAALATLNANLVNVAAAKTTWMNAQAATAAYRGYLSGGQKSNVLDEGGADVT
jgi:hypothetical protein